MSLVWRFPFHFVYILSCIDKVHICILKTAAATAAAKSL